MLYQHDVSTPFSQSHLIYNTIDGNKLSAEKLDPSEHQEHHKEWIFQCHLPKKPGIYIYINKIKQTDKVPKKEMKWKWWKHGSKKLLGLAGLRLPYGVTIVKATSKNICLKSRDIMKMWYIYTYIQWGILHSYKEW